MRTRVLGVIAGLLWLISLLLAWRPVASDYDPLPRPRNAQACRTPIRDAFGDENGLCAERARRRVGTLVVVLVLTGAASTAYVAACAADGRRRPAPE